MKSRGVPLFESAVESVCRVAITRFARIPHDVGGAGNHINNFQLANFIAVVDVESLQPFATLVMWWKAITACVTAEKVGKASRL